MEDLKEKNITGAEMWRAWEQKGKRHDKAVTRKIRLAAGFVIIVLALLVFAYYAFAAK